MDPHAYRVSGIRLGTETLPELDLGFSEEGLELSGVKPLNEKVEFFCFGGPSQ